MELTARLQGLARERGLTLNTIVQGLWAVLLGRLTGRDDVVFGVTVSGRPAELAGIEQRVGLFINTAALASAAALHATAGSAAGRDPGEPGAAAGLPARGAGGDPTGTGSGTLFDTLVVFENYPLDHAALADRWRVCG